MKLIRSENPESIGKFAILNVEKYIQEDTDKVLNNIVSAIKDNPKIIEFGKPHSPDEFFVIKLKDKYAYVALQAYATAAEQDDPEYAAEIRELASRAGLHSLFCKKPD